MQTLVGVGAIVASLQPPGEIKMTCLITSPPYTANTTHSARHSAAMIVAARAVSAFVLGAVLRDMTLQSGFEYCWEGCITAETAILDAIVQEVTNQMRHFTDVTAFAASDLYKWVASYVCGQAREILSRADVQRALDALTTALLIHSALTADEATETILLAFAAE